MSSRSSNNNIQCIISNGLVTVHHRKSMTLPTPIMLLDTIISQQPQLQQQPQTIAILVEQQAEVKIPIMPLLLLGQLLLLLLNLKIMLLWALVPVMEVMARPRVRRPRTPTTIILHTVSDVNEIMRHGGKTENNF